MGWRGVGWEEEKEEECGVEGVQWRVWDEGVWDRGMWDGGV